MKVQSPFGSFEKPPHAELELDNLINAHKGQTGAIIGTGLSVEGFNWASLKKEYGVSVTIGLNQCVKFFSPNYLCMADAHSFDLVWKYIDDKTKMVIPRRIAEHVLRRPGIIADRFNQLGMYIVPFTNKIKGKDIRDVLFFDRGIATAALALAACVGLERCYLFGLDFFRQKDKEYAYDIYPPLQTDNWKISDEPELYQTPNLKSMSDAVDRHWEKWGGIEFINMSRYSQIRCFPIDDLRALPPRGKLHVPF